MGRCAAWFVGSATARSFTGRRGAHCADFAAERRSECVTLVPRGFLVDAKPRSLTTQSGGTPPTSNQAEEARTPRGVWESTVQDMQGHLPCRQRVTGSGGAAPNEQALVRGMARRAQDCDRTPPPVGHGNVSLMPAGGRFNWRPQNVSGRHRLSRSIRGQPLGSRPVARKWTLFRLKTGPHDPKQGEISRYSQVTSNPVRGVAAGQGLFGRERPRNVEQLKLVPEVQRVRGSSPLSSTRVFTPEMPASGVATWPGTPAACRLRLDRAFLVAMAGVEVRGGRDPQWCELTA